MALLFPVSFVDIKHELFWIMMLFGLSNLFISIHTSFWGDGSTFVKRLVLRLLNLQVYGVVL